MANALTGDYEAVLQIAIRQINGILGRRSRQEACVTRMERPRTPRCRRPTARPGALEIPDAGLLT
jgi:hypothetical protein